MYIIEQIPFPDTNFIKRLLENSRKSKLSRKTKKNDPPRPPNAFFLFRNSVHFYLSSLNLKVPQISTTSGKLWFEATEETKTKYSKLQSIAKILHLEMYPGYVYRPRKNLHINSSSVNIQKPSSSTNTTTMINDNNNIVNIKSKEKDGSHPIASIDSLMINRSFNSGERCTANNNRSNDREIDDFKKERDNDHRVAEDKINYFSPQNQYEKVKRQLFEENNNTQMLENDYKSKTNELEQKCLQILKSLQQRYDNLPVESNNDNNSNILTAE
ncbi:4197_t:CDS:2, partial [Entrophospora sp. SA101]